MHIILTSLILFAAPPAEDNRLREAVVFSRNGDYEESERILSSIKNPDDAATYNFYRLVNNYSLNRRGEAAKWADLIENSLDSVPLRYRDLALMMKYDMETWEDGRDDLGDIAREMKRASDRLRNSKGGKETQKIQKDITKRLEDMIKNIEDEREAQAKKEQEDADAESRRLREQSPPPDTHAQQEEGTGRIDPKKVKQAVDNWGKLPEKERVKVMAQLMRRLPLKDRYVVEEYFRQLANKKGKK